MSHALEIEGLEKVYANGLQALKGIDLRVAQGDFFALLGPNGAGKSTTIGVICSLVNKTAGTVRVNGVDIDEDFPRAKRHLGVVPQEFNFNVFESVEDILIHQAGYYGIPLKTALERIDTYLAKLGLSDKRKTRARMLSGGMKRRLMIARDPPSPTATTRPLRGLAHPGAGSVVVDGAASADEVAAFLELARTCVEIELQAPTLSSLTHCLISTQARTLPVAPAEKAACADRSYFYDADGAFGRRFAGVAAAAWGVSVTVLE